MGVHTSGLIDVCDPPVCLSVSDLLKTRCISIRTSDSAFFENCLGIGLKLDMSRNRTQISSELNSCLN